MTERFILRTYEIRDRASERVSCLEADAKRPMEVVIREHRPRRSYEQNDKFHAVCRDVAEFTGHDVEEIKRIVKVEIGLVTKKEILGRVRTVLKSSADFTKQEMMDAIDWLYAKGAEMGVPFREDD